MPSSSTCTSPPMASWPSSTTRRSSARPTAPARWPARRWTRFARPMPAPSSPDPTTTSRSAVEGSTVPTLPEVLAWLPDDIGLVVEIKARAAADAVVEAVRDHPVRASGRLAAISFDEHAIDRVRELDREIKTGYLLVPTQPIEPALVWATEHGHTGVFPWDGDIGLDPLPLHGAGHRLRTRDRLLRRERSGPHEAPGRMWPVGLRHRRPRRRARRCSGRPRLRLALSGGGRRSGCRRRRAGSY